jgi:RimJ/RimL family protein N-acetyltransferase
MIERVETTRLVLRPITMDDVDELVALDSDPEVMRYITGGVPSSREAVETLVAQRLGSRWLAYDRAEGQFVGWFGLVPSGPAGDEIGYRVRRECWGRGLATEGACALIDAAFAGGGGEVRRIWGQTMAVNLRSRQVMQRCGMRYVRTFHLEWDDPIDGAEHGEVEYEILRPA